MAAPWPARGQQAPNFWDTMLKQYIDAGLAAVKGAVSSVNGKTGAVTLSASDVGAVSSVNGQTGVVVIPTGGNVDSVNGETGVVTLDAVDVSAIPTSGGVSNVRVMTAAAYAALGNKQSTTLYVIVG